MRASRWLLAYRCQTEFLLRWEKFVCSSPEQVCTFSKCETLRMPSEFGPSLMYRKVPFEWTAAQAIVDRKPMEGISWITSDTDERFVDVVAKCLVASLDTSDQVAV